ncbi:hypothetical protein BJX76DRAFT_338223 [Aspergillus varians]
MKQTTLLPLIVLLPSTQAWTFTWRDASGTPSTESGHGPSKCIAVDHAKGERFAADGQGEKNINMLLFTNDECTGSPAGEASVSFVKEASVALHGFQVVALDGDDATTTTDTDEDEGTFTLPTEAPTDGASSATATSTSTGTTATEDEDEDEETFTLPTEAPTSTSTAASTTETGSTTAEDEETFTLPTETPTSTSSTSTSTTGAETETETETGTETTETPSATETESDSSEPAATDGAANLVLSRNGLAGVVVGVVAGGWALDWLF